MPDPKLSGSGSPTLTRLVRAAAACGSPDSRAARAAAHELDRATLEHAAAILAGPGTSAQQLDAAMVARRAIDVLRPLPPVATEPPSPTADELRRVAAYLRGKKTGPVPDWQSIGAITTAILSQDADAIERGAREAAGRAMVDVPGVAAMLGAIAGATLLDMAARSVSSNLDLERVGSTFHERTTYVAVDLRGRRIATVTVERGTP